MKVLLLVPMADGQTGPAIKYAFEQLGHVVKAVDPRTKSIIDIFLAGREFKPDLIFCARIALLDTPVKKIKQEVDAIVCVWNCDARPSIHSWEDVFSLIKFCDYNFVVASGLIPAWQKINKNTFWLPQGVYPIYDKPKEITEEDRAKYSCDVCWIGGNERIHQWRNVCLDAIERMGINFKRWGCDGNPQLYDEAHNKAIFLSKIGLAASEFPIFEKYTSVRDYKILAAGGFLLELARDGLSEIFPSNIFDTYTSPQNLVEKIKYWLEHEKERREYAARGYDWVHKNATIVQRMQMALDYMKELN